MKRFTQLKNTRLATETDFRTANATLKLNMEYYEYMYWQKVWVLRISDEDTNREWLKTKIAQEHIQVPLQQVLWNQDPTKKLIPLSKTA